MSLSRKFLAELALRWPELGLKEGQEDDKARRVRLFVSVGCSKVWGLGGWGLVLSLSFYLCART